MTRTFKEAKSKEVVDESKEAIVISDFLKPVAIRIAVEKQVIEIVGPLDAQQRWELLKEAHFPDKVRAHIFTGVAPWQLSFKLFETSVAFGYPANVYLLQLVGLENIDSKEQDLDRVQKAMSWLLDSPQSMTNTLREHENER